MVKKEATIGFDFWEVVLKGGSHEGLAEALTDLPDDKTRAIEWGSNYLRLRSFSPWGQVFEGDIALLRMTSLPTRESTSGQSREITFKSDEGLCEASAFVFDARTGRLAIQRNRHAVTRNAVAYYLKRCYGGTTKVELRPVLKKSALRKLVSLREATRLEIAVAGPAGGPPPLKGMGLNYANKMRSYFDAPNVAFSVSVGHRKGKLNTERIKELASRVLRISSSKNSRRAEIRRFEITGRFDDEEKAESLDLLLEQLIVRVPAEESARVSPYPTRRRQARDAWGLSRAAEDAEDEEDGTES